MKLLWFNLRTDRRYVGLSFAVDWLRIAASRVESIDVITMYAGDYSLPDNVRVFSVGKEKGYGRAQRLWNFQRTLLRLLREQRYDGCFAHMMPLFATLGAPLLKWARVPTVLWFAHRSVTPVLRAAEASVDRVVTPSAQSFRLPSRKVAIIGHGVDTERFSPSGNRHARRRGLSLVSVGRISRVKRPDTLIEAFHTVEARDPGLIRALRLVGDVYDADYESELREMVREHGLVEKVEFVGAIPFERVQDEYRRADIALNTSETGSIDKAVLEAMGCGVPVITSNDAFQHMLQPWRDYLLVQNSSAGLVAERIQKLAAVDPAERQRLGEKLREIVVRDHSLDRLIGRLLTELAGVARPVPPRAS